MSYNRLSFGVLYNRWVDSSGMLSQAVLQWMSQSLIPAVNNTTPLVIPGPFANDAAAAAGGVPLQGVYYDVSGVPHVRIV